MKSHIKVILLTIILQVTFGLNLINITLASEPGKAEKLINSVMATGFSCLRADLPVNNLSYFNKIVPKLRDIRRYGSAAIDLCYVACGRIDGFWEMNLNIYDVAAGAFIVEQAGGLICDFKGSDNFPEQGIIATNKYLQKKLLENFQ